MCEADFCGEDAGTYYARKDFELWQKNGGWVGVKNHMTLRHGMLGDLADYLKASGWKLEEPVGEYEVLRARLPGRPQPLLIHDRTSGGCGYSIDERDHKVYAGWKKNRACRGLDPDWPTENERKAYWHE